MTDCPPESALRSVLEGDSVATDDESLMRHIGTCENCQRFIENEYLADEKDWYRWASEIDFDVRRQPATNRAGDPTRTTSIGEIQRQDPFSETLPEVRTPGDELPTTGGSADRPRDQFGDYRILDKLGAGGMGMVYLALQQSANRLVALKIIRPEQLSILSESKRKVWLDRFRSEAQAAARLEHDHIVRVYEVGELDGVLFYSMQYIEGQTLSGLIRQVPIENKRLARLMNSVAMAVDFAHQQGILHRDLKPHNILIRSAAETRHDSPILDGEITVPDDDRADRPYVADFGLAKNFIDGSDGSTHTGEAMGSPSYMSPEQATDASRCTPASDVYSLGATLYEALTGRPPFRSASPVETLRQVIDEPPVAPRELNRAVDLDLQTITLKALEKDPAKRYHSARQLADDLARYSKGEPIKARPISPIERTIRWTRRNPVVSLLAVGIATLLVLIAVESTISAASLKRYADRESAARREAENYFVMSLNVIQDMLAEFGDESLSHVPQMEVARRELLEKALALYVELSKAEPTNPQLKFEFARTQFRIGEVYDLLGDPQQSAEAYTKSIAMFEDLLAASPGDDESRHALAGAHAMLGETLRKTSNPESRSHLNLAIDTQRQLVNRNDRSVEYILELSQTLNNLGLLLSDSGELDGGEQRLVEAIDHLQSATRRKQVDDRTRAVCYGDLGRSQINLGVLLRKIPQRSHEATDVYYSAIDSLRHAGQLDPTNREYRFRMAVAIIDLANSLLKDGKDGVDQSIALTKDAASQFSRLCDDFPGIPLYRYELANAHNSAAVALATSNQPESAAEQFDKARTILVGLQNEAPSIAASDARYSSLFGRVLGGLGFLKTIQNDWDGARRLVEQAIEYQQNAVELHPSNPEYASFLSQHRGFLEQILAEQNSKQQ